MPPSTDWSKPITPEAHFLVVPLGLFVSPYTALPLVECDSTALPSPDEDTRPSPGPLCTILKHDVPFEHALSGDACARAACALLNPASVRPAVNRAIATVMRSRYHAFGVRNIGHPFQACGVEPSLGVQA